MSSTGSRKLHRLFYQPKSGWNPQLTVENTTPAMIIIGIVFIIVGFILLLIFRHNQEIIIDYTYCNSTTTPEKTCAEIIGMNTNRTCKCRIPFNITAEILAPVYLYYQLTNFYQNHRNYMSSRDNYQLRGELSSEVSSDCYPYDYITNGSTKIPIAPCGAIANSMFSDKLDLFSEETKKYVQLIKTNITWPIFKSVKYQNPPGDLKEAFKNYAKPINWKKNIWELDETDPSNNGFENEDFIVWMQTSTLSDFRKTYRRVNHTKTYNRSLTKGRYVLVVTYSYPTAIFNGTKSLVIANTSILGVKNTFLVVCYFIVGIASLLCALAFWGSSKYMGKLYQ